MTPEGMSPILRPTALGSVGDPETVTRVRDFILANPDIHNDTSRYITGGGLDHTIWPTSRWPTAVRMPYLIRVRY
jgi:hypothetical protein